MRKLVIGCGLFLILTFSAQGSLAFWIWTPETGRFVNPKYAAKETAEEQFQWALEFYEEKDYSRAIKEWEKLIKHFPLSELAPEARYHIGLAYQAMGGHYDAYLAYQKVLDQCPQTKRVNEIIEKEYQIANLFYTAKGTELLGISLASKKERAVEIFRKVIENAPYGEYADIAQYKIGLYYWESGRYEEAIGEFRKIIDDYPKSELLDDARFQIALCFFKLYLRTEYDQEAIDKAIKELENFIEDFPEELRMVEEAHKILAQLNEKKAEHAFKIAQFYERQGSIESAVIYYKEVRDKYGGTSWAAKALERIIALEKGSGS